MMMEPPASRMTVAQAEGKMCLGLPIGDRCDQEIVVGSVQQEDQKTCFQGGKGAVAPHLRSTIIFNNSYYLPKHSWPSFTVYFFWRVIAESLKIILIFQEFFLASSFRRGV